MTCQRSAAGNKEQERVRQQPRKSVLEQGIREQQVNLPYHMRPAPDSALDASPERAGFGRGNKTFLAGEPIFYSMP